MPNKGRPREFDRDAALHSAMLVFWRKGFLATSMNDLCEAMEIRAPSLYAAFGSKEDLYIEALRRYNGLAHQLIWDRIDGEPTVQEGVRRVLLAASEVLPEGQDTPSGCMVNLATMGHGPIGTAPDAVKAARLDGLKALRSGIERAVASGELPHGTDTERLSRFYMGVIQGMAVQAYDGANQEDLAGMAEAAMAAWPVK
ncbi:TetR/AcrR family transcriptional regulator [Paraburkholderia bengalensis]|uniref:TetR/AcrR family transcriptional regulator n=1 Tax=Paraburkholderia bengalensis TaxID=2747562 RepID=A0ABU8J2U6_9BURK